MAWIPFKKDGSDGYGCSSFLSYFTGWWVNGAILFSNTHHTSQKMFCFLSRSRIPLCCPVAPFNLYPYLIPRNSISITFALETKWEGEGVQITSCLAGFRIIGVGHGAEKESGCREDFWFLLPSFLKSTGSEQQSSVVFFLHPGEPPVRVQAALPIWLVLGLWIFCFFCMRGALAVYVCFGCGRGAGYASFSWLALSFSDCLWGWVF